MKIENSNLNPITPNKAEKTEGIQPTRAQAQGAEATSTVSAKDRAELSERARLLGKARAALDETSQVDEAHVAEMQQKVQTGDYKIDLEQLAQRLLRRLGIKKP